MLRQIYRHEWRNPDLNTTSLLITFKLLNMGKFVISKRTNGEFQFNLKADNGQVILSSEGYASKASCQNGIESVRNNSQEDSRFELKTAKNGKFFFNLKATNGQVIGSSEMYESESGRKNGIESVKKNAPGASVEDSTLA